MPTESEYGEDVRLLDDLTRLKLRQMDKKLNPNFSQRRRYDRRAYTPDYYPPTPPERRIDRFYVKLDRRNELLEKLWEELGSDGSFYRRRRYLPLMTPPTYYRREEEYMPWMEEHLINKPGNTKKDLMELMLIQNSQMQQWMMTQTLQRRQGGERDGAVHNHYYDSGRPPLPPIPRADAGNQYPQDFFQPLPPPPPPPNGNVEYPINSLQQPPQPKRKNKKKKR